MEILFRTVGAALTAVILILFIRDKSRDIAFLLSGIACIVILGLIFPVFSAIYQNLSRIGEISGIGGELLSPVLKVVVIAVVSRLTAEQCRDSGERAIAADIEIAAAALCIVCTLPLIQKVLYLIGEL